MCTGLAVAHLSVAVMVVCYAAYVAMRQYSQAKGRLGDVTMTVSQVEVSRGRLPQKTHTYQRDVALNQRLNHQHTTVLSGVQRTTAGPSPLRDAGRPARVVRGVPGATHVPGWLSR